MIDKGINSGLVQKFDTTKKTAKAFFGFRKMFWDYLNKMNVPFSDPCCSTANTSTVAPVGVIASELRYFNGTSWVAVPAIDFALPAAPTFTTSVTSPLLIATTSTTSPTVITDSITEKTAGAGITLKKAIIKQTTLSAINSTATATTAQVASGTITSTSAAATSITLPTATALATALGAARGTSFTFFVDNSVGANTVTMIVGSGIVAESVITGGTTLTVASGSVGTFNLFFTSTTTALIARIA